MATEGDTMSVQAMSWVLEHAPKGTSPAKRLVLLGLANHADPDGTEAFPSIGTLSRYAGISERQVKRLLIDLEADGVIERGDQEAALRKIGRKDRCPVVWTLVDLHRMHSADGVTDCPSPLERGDISGSRGDISTERGDTAMSPEPSLRTVHDEPSDKTNVGTDLELHQPDTLPVSCKQDDVRTVFDAWVSICERDRSRTKLTADRRNKIKARLREGYTVDDLIATCHGVMRSDFHRGDNPNGTVYTDIKTIFRDGSQVEKFSQMNEQQPRSKVPKNLQGLEDWARKSGVMA
jgi:hypothetical protein